MIYGAIPIVVLGMLAYMFWRIAAQMRRDRIVNEREATRGTYAFSPMHRARFLLRHAFGLTKDEPRWQQDFRRAMDDASD
jgi:hypothetical protein